MFFLYFAFTHKIKLDFKWAGSHWVLFQNIIFLPQQMNSIRKTLFKLYVMSTYKKKTCKYYLYKQIFSIYTNNFLFNHIFKIYKFNIHDII